MRRGQGTAEAEGLADVAPGYEGGRRYTGATMSMTGRSRALYVSLFGLALSLGAGAALEGQELGSFAGTIVDDLSGLPLASAVVSLPKLQLEAATNENGQFLLEGLPLGSQEVKFEASGYVGVVEQLEIAASDFLQVRLDPLATVLDRILVIAGRSPSDQPVNVLHVPASDRPWQSALDLLADQVPGVTVRQGGGLANGAAIVLRGFNSFRSDGAPMVFVDGVRIDSQQSGYNSIHALDMISAETVSRIRVLKGASGVSGYSNGANGVILIETIHGSGSRN